MLKAMLAIVGVGFLLLVIACCGGVPTTTTNPPFVGNRPVGEASDRPATDSAEPRVAVANEYRTPIDRSIQITMAEFNQLVSGISYDQAFEIVGYHGEEISRVRIADIETVMVQWVNTDGSNANATFQNGRLVARAQSLLPHGPSPLNFDKALREAEAASDRARLREAQQAAARLQHAAGEARRRAELEALDKTAAAELDALLAAAGDLSTVKQIDAFRQRLEAFVDEYEGTASAERARVESDALASLRLACVWAETPGRDPTRRLQQVISEHAGTVAAASAETKLGTAE